MQAKFQQAKNPKKKQNEKLVELWKLSLQYTKKSSQILFHFNGFIFG